MGKQVASAVPTAVRSNFSVPDAKSAEQLDRITRLAGRLAQTPFAYARCADAQGRSFESWQGVAAEDLARFRDFCRHPILGFGTVSNADLVGDRRFRDHSIVVERPHVRYFAGCPLTDRRAQVIGRLSVFDSSPHPAGGDDLDALTDLAQLDGDMLDRPTHDPSEPPRRFGPSARGEPGDQLTPLDVGIGLLFWAVREAVIVGDVDTDRIALWNPAAALMFGYSSEEIVGSPIGILIPGALKAGHHDGLSQYRATGRGRIVDGRHAVDVTALCKDGREIDVELSLSPIEKRMAGRRLVVAVARDVTERKALDRMKSEFVSMVSHELRTPLTSMRGSLGLLASGAFGPVAANGKRMLDIAVRNTDRLARLINDILDLERIQAGHTFTEMKSCDAEDLMRVATELVESLAAESEIAIQVSTAPARLHADPDRVVQLLTNLLNNAIKFSPPHSVVTLSVEVRPTELVFQVADQGRGIPLDKQAIIFERFQQIDASDSRDKGGTGLGLAICREIALQHGGRIWVESAVGVGSTFSAALPVKPILDSVGAG
ncbi:MAG: ATP-binding protein [Chloroflexota bacterium]